MQMALKHLLESLQKVDAVVVTVTILLETEDVHCYLKQPKQCSFLLATVEAESPGLIFT